MGIDFRNVSYTHAKRSPMAHRAVNDITCSIPDGQFVAVMGPSGSGKSTLGQLGAGLLHPDTGIVYVDNIPTNNKRSRSDAWNKVAYVSQFPEHQLIEESVFRDISYGLRSMKYNDREITVKVKEAMESVGLSFEQYKDRAPSQLSGGEKRRVALAGTIILKPKILILDEPTAGLDPLTRVKFLALLTFLQRTRRLTIVCITHHLQDALEHADRLLIINRGQLIRDLKITEIRSVLEDPDIPLSSTPLLRFLNELESLFGGKIDPELVQEYKLLTFIAERLTRT
ncbi:ATP-binding cassette domain-containing protein [Paenibacillus thermotolerans]|uniref:ATP-binding cassette domain-containing protein n=1 Tax=Paenibacillus thermotolerans TaxID=3027807 RepID=UPI0023683F91|nr:MULTISPECIES: ATP-binding cassette domain-containing protein [unclassified Paenibacillus]